MVGSILYVVATPIGNLEDITQRALRILKECDLIAAEDTRVAGKLLSAYGITGKATISYYDEVEVKRADDVIRRMTEAPLKVALISDAGTPLISDPGYHLVGKARAAGIPVVPIPGASSVTALMSASGLPCHRFQFVGFLPDKAGALKREIETWRSVSGTVVFLEATRRLEKTLSAIQEVIPTARVAIGRELTKMFEEIVVLDIADAIQWCDRPESKRGEVTVVIDPRAENGGAPDIDRDTLRKEAAAAMRNGASLKELLQTMKDRGLSRGELYQLLLDAKKDALV